MKYRKRWPAQMRGRNITRLMSRDGTDCMICRQPLDRHVKDPNHDDHAAIVAIKMRLGWHSTEPRAVLA